MGSAVRAFAGIKTLESQPSFLVKAYKRLHQKDISPIRVPSDDDVARSNLCSRIDQHFVARLECRQHRPATDLVAFKTP